MNMIPHQKYSSLKFFTTGHQILLYHLLYNAKDTHFIHFQFSTYRIVILDVVQHRQ